MHSRSPVLKKIPKPANAEYPQEAAAGEEESLQRETSFEISFGAALVLIAVVCLALTLLAVAWHWK